METWKPVTDFPGYEVSDLGRVRSYRRSSVPRILKPGHSRGGLKVKGTDLPTTCLVLTLRRDGKTITKRVHQLVAETFVGPRPDGLEVRHLDGDYTNNRLSNLKYGTKSENSLDAMRHGTHVALVRSVGRKVA